MNLSKISFFKRKLKKYCNPIILGGIFLSQNVFADSNLYMVDSAGVLYKLDHLTGVATSIGSTGGSTDIAADCSNFYSANWGVFSKVNPSTGVSTVIGNIGYSVNALAVSPQGKVYGAAGSEFIEINPTTGQGTRIGSYGSGFSSSGDLAFDNGGNLYATALGGDKLLRINVTTGAATLIGTIGYPSVYGISFKDDVLYGVTEGGLLLKINTTTGAGTVVGRNGKYQWGLATLQKNCECSNPATYDAETGLVSLPAIDIPLLSPISGEPTGEIAVFSGKIKQVQGVEDFEILGNSLSFIKTIPQYDETHARYEYNDGIFSNGGKLKACVSVPSIAIIPPNTRIITDSKNYKVSLRQLAVSPNIFHLESAALVTP